MATVSPQISANMDYPYIDEGSEVELPGAHEHLYPGPNPEFIKGPGIEADVRAELTL